MNSHQIYVVDTNVIIDYVDLIPEAGISLPLREPSVELVGAQVVIPTASVRELSKLKKERHTDRGRSATIALDRLSRLVLKAGVDISQIYSLNHPLTIANCDYELIILPVHKNFAKCLPFNPSDSDMDGQIILTALTAIYLKNGKKIDGSEPESALYTLDTAGVTLLTNDKGLLSRAFARGVPIAKFRCNVPEEYTGRRDLEVPDSLYEIFMIEKVISRELWESEMPDEPPLIANEFLIMHTPSGVNYDPFGGINQRYWPNIGRYNVETDEIVHLRYIAEAPIEIKTAGGAIYIESLFDPDIKLVICTGPAGCGKTYQATSSAVELCRRGDFVGTVVVPCIQDGAGTLPGDLNAKLDPDVKPIKNAIENYLLETDPTIRKKLAEFKKNSKKRSLAEELEGQVGDNGSSNGSSGRNKERDSSRDDDKSENGRNSNRANEKSIVAKLEEMVELTWDRWFRNYHIENVRGRSFKNRFILLDEFQDQNMRQADTLITRPNDDSKVVLTGDVEQVHANYLDRENNGLTYACDMFKGAPMVARCHFLESENMRGKLVQWVLDRKAERRKMREEV